MPFADLELFTGIICIVLYCMIIIPGLCFSNEEMDVNFAFVGIEGLEVALMRGLVWFHYIFFLLLDLECL